MSEHYDHDLWHRGYKIGAQALGSYASHRMRNYFQSTRERAAKAKWNARLNLGAHNRMDESELTQDGGATSRTNATFSSSGSVITGTPAANRQQTNAKRILRGVRASSTRPTALKAAMFLPGKGAEVDLIANNYLRPIEHRINWKQPKLRYDGVTSAFENPKGNRVSMDFAFKMILECQKTGLTAQHDPANPNVLVPTRFHCANVFRHTNSNAVASNAQPTWGSSSKWHTTLGPDASYIRLLPIAGGSLQGTAVFNSNFTNTLKSPYRLPLNGSTMWTRMNLQILENAGWNLNPMKLTGTLAGGETFGTINAFQNADYAQPGDTAASTSHPYSQRIGSTQGTGSVAVKSQNKYITQHGPGGVRYNFSNDGTNAVTLECVVIGFKKTSNDASAQDYGLSAPYDSFVSNISKAYEARKAAKAGIRNLGGDDHSQVNPQGADAAIFSNAETDFIPNNLWSWMGKGAVSAPGVLTQQPFKYISRDQFIIGGGQSRIWKTTFPKDTYDATEDSPQAYPNVNSHSYMVIWSVCSAPLPCMESAKAPPDPTTDIVVDQGKILLSREPQNCNVSCVGTYFETPTPVYCEMESVPLNMVGSLGQVSIMPFSDTPLATQWPIGSAPYVAGTVPVYNKTVIPDGHTPSTNYTSGLMYVDLPRSGQQPFVGDAVDVLQIGTLSTLE